jgi:Secretion system C-terminal sorting domain
MYQLYLVKTDNIGDTIWTRSYGVNANTFNISVKQTFDGGYVIGNDYSRLLKTDSLGNILWCYNYQGSVDQVIETYDSCIVAVGKSQMFGGGDDDVYLIKTDSSGNLLWAKTYGGTGNDHANDVKQMPDGGLVIIGTTYSFSGYASIVIRTDQAGDTLWTRAYQNTFISIDKCGDGGYILTGFKYTGTSNRDIMLARLDSLGNVIWSNLYGGPDFDTPACGRQTTDGGFVITGYTPYNSPVDDRCYVIKTDSLGNSGCYQSTASMLTANPLISVSSPSPVRSIMQLPSFTYSTLVGTGGTEIDHCASSDLQEETHYSPIVSYIFPNPASSQFTLTFSLEINEAVIQIFDMLGKKRIEVLLANTKSETIDVSNIPTGIYTIRIHSGENHISKMLRIIKN